MMIPCESCPARLALTQWRMTISASSAGAPLATSSASPIAFTRSAGTLGIVAPPVTALARFACKAGLQLGQSLQCVRRQRPLVHGSNGVLQLFERGRTDQHRPDGGVGDGKAQRTFDQIAHVA